MKNVLVAMLIAFAVSPVMAKPNAKNEFKPHYSKGDGSIKVLGHDGKYPVFDIDSTDLDDIRYHVGDVVHDQESLRKALPTIKPADVNKNGYICEFLCVNSKRQVVGWNPMIRN